MRRFISRALFLYASLVAVAATADPAHAAPVGPAEAVAQERKHDCVETSESAQQLRLDGKLVEAQTKLVECSSSACPEAVRADCARWLGEVNAVMPTVVLVAHDGAGEDIGDVTVTMDGQPFSSKLDGKAAPVAPGDHVFRFARPGAIVVEKKVIVHEGEKARKIEVTLGAADAATTSPEEPKKTGPGVLPWIIVGVGAVAVVSGIVLYAVPSTPPDCSGGNCKTYFDDGTLNNTPNAKDTDPSTGKPFDCLTHNTLNGCSRSAKNRQRESDAGTAAGLRDVGILTAGVGGAMIVGGVIYYLVARPKASEEKAGVQVMPFVSPTARGLALGGTF